MKLYLIDGNSYVYRAFYAIQGLANSKGMPTNAIYGFTNTLLRIIRERKPDGIVISFDSPVPTGRHRMFGEYKAHRPETPADLVVQLSPIREIITALNIPIFEVPGYEADDILATIALRAAGDGAEVYIVTADKDMLQVVSDRIRVYDPVKDRVLDRNHVQEKFGVGPERIAEFMALTGDAVDNIPGVKGIGEKTARELLSRCGDLEDLLAHPEQIPSERIRKLITDNADSARMSRVLATVLTDVPVPFSLENFLLREPDWPTLLTLFREFEFGSFMKMIPSAKGHRSYEAITTLETLRDFLADVRDEFSLDLEATGRDPLRDRTVGIALCREKGKAAYVPVGHSSVPAERQANREEALKAMRSVLENPDIAKIGHNLKYDLTLLDSEGASVKGTLCDTMIASYLLNPNKANHSLGDVSFEHLSYRKKTFAEVLGKRGTFAEVPLSEAVSYAAEDAALAFELKEVLFPRLREEGLEQLYFTIEMPLIPVLIGIEKAGFRIDVEKMNALSREISGELDAIQRRVYFLAGEEFNINSPKQLGKVLFQNLGLTPGKKTKSGFSTEGGVLEELAKSHELPGEVLNYRSLSKLKSTYTDVLPRIINPLTGRIHTSFNQAATATGRLSSSDPNLQNIPVRGEWGRRIREAFVPAEGCLILSADYSQIELRILAHLSRDEELTGAFMSGEDIHSQTAAGIFRVSPEKVTQEMRRIAKTVNFGIVYGMTPFGLSEALGIQRDEAKGYIDNYFERHPGVKGYFERILNEARQRGYVTTMYGRKRAVPEIQSRNPNTKAQGERLALNSPVQGSAADIIKLAMIRINGTLKQKNPGARMVLQVHDELVFEVPEELLQATEQMVREGMEQAAELSVPLKVEIGYGGNWAEAHV